MERFNMNAIKEFMYDESAVRTMVDNNNVVWFVGRDVATLLGYKNTKDVLGRFVEEGDKNTSLPLTDILGRVQYPTCINKNGVLSLILKSKLPRAMDYAKSLDIPILRSTKEQETMHTLVASFKNYDPKTQYKVGRYRVDLYLPSSRIAVECDEFGHKGYCDVEEGIRQDYIEKELGCTFVRFNPDTKDFNIGDVICEVLHFIDVAKQEELKNNTTMEEI